MGKQLKNKNDIMKNAWVKIKHLNIWNYRFRRIGSVNGVLGFIDPNNHKYVVLLNYQWCLKNDHIFRYKIMMILVA